MDLELFLCVFLMIAIIVGCIVYYTKVATTVAKRKVEEMSMNPSQIEDSISNSSAKTQDNNPKLETKEKEAEESENMESEDDFDEDFDEIFEDFTPSTYLLPEEIIQRIETEKLYAKSITLNSLAEKFNTNRTYLSNAIQHYTGTNLADYISQLRIEEAERLMASPDYSEKDLATISKKCGYSSQRSFYRDYTLHVGISPLRRMQQLKQEQDSK